MIWAYIPADRLSLIRLAEAHYNPSLAKVNHDRISAISWPADSASPMTLQLMEPMASDQIEAVSFLLAMTSINYRFWQLLPDGALDRYRHLGKSGARALWAAFEAAWGPTANAGTELAQHLRADEFTVLFGNIPDREGRLAILGEVIEPGKLSAVAKTLVAEIRASRRVTVRQAAGLAQQFPLAFDDPYLKKAQLALSMIASSIRDTGTDVDATDLTAFADYQVPRVMRALSVIEYSPPLADKIDHYVPIEEGGREEQAIRAATIVACEAIAAHTGGTSADIDNLLWQSQGVAGDTPFHLTKTRRY